MSQNSPCAVISNFTVPFFATLKVEYDCFHYFVCGVNEIGLVISVPESLKYKHQLEELDLVNFHLPIETPSGIATAGRVVNIINEEKQVTYHLALIETLEREYPLVLESSADSFKTHFNKSIDDTLVHSIKEMYLLKSGVQVYLRHLEVYFSRIIGYAFKKYRAFSVFFFQDAEQKIEAKIKWIEEVYQTYLQSDSKEQIIKTLDFAALSSFVDSEVLLDVLNVAFKTTKHMPYIIAIKELEEMMLFHYNTLVLLHLALETQQNPQPQPRPQA